MIFLEENREPRCRPPGSSGCSTAVTLPGNPFTLFFVMLIPHVLIALITLGLNVAPGAVSLVIYFLAIGSAEEKFASE